MLYIPSWLFIILMSSKLCGCTLSVSDLGHHLFHTANASSDQLPAWTPDASGSEHSHQYNIQTQNGYSPEAESFLANYYAGMRHVSPLQDAQQRRVFAYLDRRPDYRTSAYQDQQVAHSEVEYDVAPLRKHDFTDQGGYGGGWDMFPGGPGQGSGGLAAQVGGLALVKKGKGAKALFALMAPLILLAVFGPILATQAMIPWVANGGLSTVTAVAQGRRRRRRSYPNPELEKRLRLFLEVQDFIARSGSSARLAEEMGEAFLRCQKFTERRSKCLERVACEYTDETSPMDPAERRLAKMVLQNIASNPMIPATIKGRLSKGSAFGRHNRGRCKNYWCEAIDGSRGKPRT